jgi:hypothetical protein
MGFCGVNGLQHTPRNAFFGLGQRLFDESERVPAFSTHPCALYSVRGVVGAKR